MTNQNNKTSDSTDRPLTSWNSQPVDSYEYRRQLAQQEPIGKGLFYAAAAGVAGSAFIGPKPRMAVKVLTPLTLAALTANYFLPAHSDYYFNNMGRPLRFGRTADVDLRQPDNAGSTTADLKKSAEAAVGDISREVGTAWSDVKSKAEGIADTYRTVAEEETSKLVNKSTQDAKFWLDQQKAEVDRMLGRKDAQSSSATASSGQSGTLGRMFSSDFSSESARRRADDLRETSLRPEEQWWNQKRAEAKASSASAGTGSSSAQATTSEMPTSAGPYNFFGWWRSAESDSSKPELEVKIAPQPSKKDDHHAYVENKLHEANIRPHQKRRPSNADLHVAKEAIRGHDAVVTRGATLGIVDAEVTARKVHDNVIDAAVPRNRQTRYEPHDVQETRSIYEKTNRKVNKFKTTPAQYLDNLDRRTHMMLNGVEHYEHSISKKMEKLLQEEADFWHEQALKDEARARAMEAQANEANARGERAF
ncbi:hypothetical protein BGW41_007156 [Actinomortierella wolfii]|nr:hypothetical protein BGW41_007156 [Actinomortierella wolfii]